MLNTDGKKDEIKMGHICTFEVIISGIKDETARANVLGIFLNHFYQNGTVTTNDTNRPWMYIYNCSVTEATKSILIASGTCKWNVFTSMLADGYYADKDDWDRYENYTCLEEISKQYGVNIEARGHVWNLSTSDKFRYCDNEHIVVCNGEVVINVVTTHYEADICDSYEEFCAAVIQSDIRANMGIIEEQDWQRKKKEGKPFLIYNESMPNALF